MTYEVTRDSVLGVLVLGTYEKVGTTRDIRSRTLRKLHIRQRREPTGLDRSESDTTPKWS